MHMGYHKWITWILCHQNWFLSNRKQTDVTEIGSKVQVKLAGEVEQDISLLQELSCSFFFFCLRLDKSGKLTEYFDYIGIKFVIIFAIWSFLKEKCVSIVFTLCSTGPKWPKIARYCFKLRWFSTRLAGKPIFWIHKKQVMNYSSTWEEYDEENAEFLKSSGETDRFRKNRRSRTNSTLTPLSILLCRVVWVCVWVWWSKTRTKSSVCFVRTPSLQF